MAAKSSSNLKVRTRVRTKVRTEFYLANVIPSSPWSSWIVGHRFLRRILGNYPEKQ